MKHNKKQQLLDLAQSTAAHLEQFGGAVHSALEHAPEKIDQIRETVGPALDKLYETFANFESRVEDKASETRDQAAELRNHAAGLKDVVQRKQRNVKKVLLDDAQVDHDSTKFVWLLIGLGAGALLGLFLAPSSGRRSRARVRDQFNKKRNDLTRATSNHTSDLSNKAKGLKHKIEKTIHPGDNEVPTDEILTDRVRTALGQDPETKVPHLNIECCDGVVTLYGPTVNVMQEAALINAVVDVPGVVDVKSKLPVSSD